MFSGLNLAFFSIGKMQLQIETSNGNLAAQKVLKMREDANFLLTTILWGNVGINVLLTLLSNSVMVGFAAFIFSTFIITLFGEITPQAYFSRNALRMASALAPVLKLYQLLLWPLAKPSALLLDMWLGKESLQYYRENEITEMIRMHMNERGTEITHVEGNGVLNFLALDDLKVSEEGERLDPNSIIALEFDGNRPVLPDIKSSVDDPFLCRLHQAKRSWCVLTDMKENPRLVIDTDAFISAALFEYSSFVPQNFCHRPVIISNMDTTLGDALPSLSNYASHDEDDVIENDIILIWGKERRIITGADILGRLFRGIAKK